MATEARTNKGKDETAPIIIVKGGTTMPRSGQAPARAGKRVIYKTIPKDDITLIARSSSEVVVSNVRSGFSAEQVKGFLELYELPQVEFAESVGFNPRTLHRRFRAGAEAFVGEDAAKVIRYAKVLCQAVEVFRTTERAKEWMRTVNPTLPGGEAPAALLDTEFGAEEVIESLVRIRHGIFA